MIITTYTVNFTYENSEQGSISVNSLPDARKTAMDMIRSNPRCLVTIIKDSFEDSIPDSHRYSSEYYFVRGRTIIRKDLMSNL